jgi:biofilm protein TabA
MVVSDVDRMAEQVAMTPNMKKALDFIHTSRGKELADGRVDIDGDQVYALVQSYDTSLAGDKPRLEGHKKYIDVQYVLSGHEIIGWALTDRVDVTVQYDDAKDVWFGVADPSEFTPVHVFTGEAAIFYPTDAHAPRLAAGKPSFVKKVVIKVAV